MSHSTTSDSTAAQVGKSSSMERRKQTPNDYIFGKLIGEGSFSSVFLAREIATGRELAIKMCEKEHILKERKQEYIKSEKDILVKINSEWDERRPFFVRLHSTFHDARNLYFVMTYAKKGDLLNFIQDMANRDVDCTQFYAAELVSALEFLHERRIIHRDLKPENILLNERMHILITDFGSAKILPSDDENGDHTALGYHSLPPADGVVIGGSGEGAGVEPGRRIINGVSQYNASGAASEEPVPCKRSSFVGTAQYVSPEVLSGGVTSYASDLWAFGCVLYQMVTGMPPFQSQSEFLIFQKIQKLEYTFYEGFDEQAKDLIKQLLKIEPQLRLGAKDSTRYSSLRTHSFFEGVDFAALPDSTPPAISEFIPKEDRPDSCWERDPNMEPGPGRIPKLLIGADGDEELDDVLQKLRNNEGVNSPSKSGATSQGQKRQQRNLANLSPRQREELLEEQTKSNKFHKFVEGNLILKQGILDKKKGLWSRRRMFLLTEGPGLYYVDADNMVLKGRIPWDKTIRTELRDFKIFFVHTPNRIYYLIDPESTAKDWCHAIGQVRQHYYGEES